MYAQCKRTRTNDGVEWAAFGVCGDDIIDVKTVY